jgi:hypothetical protein
MQLQSKYPFLQYASIYWIHHTTGFRQGKSKTWALWKRMVFAGHSLAKMPWKHDWFNADDPVTLDWVYKCPHYALIPYALSSGLSVTQLRDWVQKWDSKTLEIILGDNIKNSGLQQAFWDAARDGELAIVEKLVEAGIDMNYANKFELALESAAENDHSDVVEKLLSAGSYHIVVGVFSAVLDRAAKNGCLKTVETLLSAGADVNFPKHLSPALFGAVQSGHLEVVSTLLGAGANVNAINDERRTALHEAARAGHLAVVNKLILNGADAFATDIDGQTARAKAEEMSGKDYLYIAQILERVEREVSFGLDPLSALFA